MKESTKTIVIRKNAILLMKDVPQEVKNDIVKYFKTNKNNEISTMATKFGFSPSQINRIIDEEYVNRVTASK